MEIKIKSKIRDYQVIINNNLLLEAKNHLNLNRKVLIVSDDQIPTNYIEALKIQCLESFIYLIPSGETSKNITNYQNIIAFLMENHFSRKDCIVALGGGVVGDLSGFVSATYMRGLDFYNIPTTLLAQVDSSIGGKTAIDYLGYKNIIGAFNPPLKVLIDPLTLNTLDERQLHAGLVESLKMALTFDADLFTLIENSYDLRKDLPNIIYKSLLIKKYVVEQDEKESNLRKVLNFGHTIGHAIESYYQMKLLHGECVGLGMLYMVSPLIKKRLEAILLKYHLPIKVDLDIQKITNLITLDKKSNNEHIDIIIVRKIGQYEIKTIAINEIKKYLKGEVEL